MGIGVSKLQAVCCNYQTSRPPSTVHSQSKSKLRQPPPSSSDPTVVDLDDLFAAIRSFCERMKFKIPFTFKLAINTTGGVLTLWFGTVSSIRQIGADINDVVVSNKRIASKKQFPILQKFEQLCSGRKKERIIANMFMAPATTLMGLSMLIAEDGLLGLGWPVLSSWSVTLANIGIPLIACYGLIAGFSECFILRRCNCLLQCLQAKSNSEILLEARPVLQQYLDDQKYWHTARLIGHVMFTGGVLVNWLLTPWGLLPMLLGVAIALAVPLWLEAITPDAQATEIATEDTQNPALLLKKLFEKNKKINLCQKLQLQLENYYKHQKIIDALMLVITVSAGFWLLTVTTGLLPFVLPSLLLGSLWLVNIAVPLSSVYTLVVAAGDCIIGSRCNRLLQQLQTLPDSILPARKDLQQYLRTQRSLRIYRLFGQIAFTAGMVVYWWLLIPWGMVLMLLGILMAFGASWWLKPTVPNEKIATVATESQEMRSLLIERLLEDTENINLCELLLLHLQQSSSSELV